MNTPQTKRLTSSLPGEGTPEGQGGASGGASSGASRYRGYSGEFTLQMQRREKILTELRLPWYCRCEYKIAYAVDYRGVNDDITTISFRGAELSLLSRVFRYLFGDAETRSHLCGKIHIEREYDCVARNGYGNKRIAVMLYDFNTNLIDLDTFLMIMESVMQRECNCKVTHLTLGRFLNV